MRHWGESYEDRREREREERKHEDDFHSDVSYEMWRSGRSSNNVDYDRVSNGFRDGRTAYDVASDFIREQRRQEERQDEERREQEERDAQERRAYDEEQERAAYEAEQARIAEELRMKPIRDEFARADEQAGYKTDI